jgi:hypothetical protein
MIYKLQIPQKGYIVCDVEADTIYEAIEKLKQTGRTAKNTAAYFVDDDLDNIEEWVGEVFEFNNPTDLLYYPSQPFDKPRDDQQDHPAG